MRDAVSPLPSSALARRRLTAVGQVQGVGFRPFVFRLAEEHGLTGLARNAPEGVVIEIQGPAEAVAAFAADLPRRLPPLARLTGLAMLDVPPRPDETAFVIEASAPGGQGHQVLVSPDVAACPDCLRELLDPADRRFLYPFINCVNCGPRYTITRALPYDRDKTAMACFPLCPRCRQEYEDVRDRRFHAQPNACPVCGPRVWLTEACGGRPAPVPVRSDRGAGPDGADRPAPRPLAEGDEAVRRAAELLAEGGIVAVKGLGGFHLACDAGSDRAVAELRRRKRRPGKPLAVMVPDLETARALAETCPEEEAMLAGRERPIVLLRRKAEAAACLAEGLAPDTDWLGVMLPYAPLQHVLFFHSRRCLARRGGLAGGRPPVLVMTSGNLGGEPIALGNREALARLAGLADAFLLHDRDILVRADDSVVRYNPELAACQFLRRARGFTPAPVALPPLPAPASPSSPSSPAASAEATLGVGPELKSTICYAKGDQAFVSQHVGDLRNLETLDFHREMTAHLADILQVRPAAVAADRHPDYASTAEAESLAARLGAPLFRLQHHYAHAHAVLAEHGHAGPAVCLTLDGAGLGEDGTIWGGECLYVDGLDQRRLGRLDPMLQPGGEAAARQPWRMARSCLHALGLDAPAGRPWPWLTAELAQADRLVGQMLAKGINCPVTTSCGRLFDALAGLLGLCLEMTYEGQAAIRLEAVQDMTETGAYPCPVRPGGPDAAGTDVPLTLGSLELFRAAHADWQAGVAAGIVSRRFHRGLTAGLAELARRAAEPRGARVVGLSGGVMQNLTLARELPRALKAQGLIPLSHLAVPPNDACVSLGQAAWARLRRAAGPDAG